VLDEIKLAFAHPIERSMSDQKPNPFDRISVRDYTVSVEIGAFQHERGVEQRVRFNVVVEVNPPQGALEDDVDRILSYDTVTDAIDAALEHERLNLLETVAERVASRILEEPIAARVFVRVEKLDRGPGALGVEIVRDALCADPKTEPHHAAQPRVIFLSNIAIKSENMAQWLDELANQKEPVVLTLGMPDVPRLTVASAIAQRTVDLLSIDQNAWALAAIDGRCRVVSTKTELDWSMKHGLISIWAPSKMILDAVMPPLADAEKAHEYSIWLAQMIKARAITFVDCAVSCVSEIPMSHVDLGAEHI
jgi:dihydroneopterin aldolase